MELNESIEKAIIRELKEETGIKGKVLRLLDTNSRYNGIYGDLIWVTFEIKKSSEKVIAGDDARDAKYFPINDLAKLSFSANRQAVKRLIKTYRNLWQMEDSIKNIEKKQEKNTKAFKKEKVKEENNQKMFHSINKLLAKSNNSKIKQNIDKKQNKIPDISSIFFTKSSSETNFLFNSKSLFNFL